MGRFRPRGNQMQRAIGKSVAKGLNEYHRNKSKGNYRAGNNTSDTGCITVIVTIILLLILLTTCSTILSWLEKVLMKLKDWFIFFGIFLIIIGAFLLNSKLSEKKDREAYDNAISLMSSSDFYSAIELFRYLEGFEDSEMKVQEIEQLLYEEAIDSISIDDFDTANNILNELRYSKEDYDDKIKYKIEEKERKDLIAVLKDSEPYVGLEEDLILYTTWGAPDEIELCIDYDKKRESHQSKEYIWYESDGRKDKVINVMNKKVIRVYDIEY